MNVNALVIRNNADNFVNNRENNNPPAKFFKCSPKLHALIILIAKISLTIFIVPVFFKSYRLWVKASYIEFNSNNNPILPDKPIPNPLDLKEPEEIPQEIPQEKPLNNEIDLLPKEPEDIPNEDNVALLNQKKILDKEKIFEKCRNDQDYWDFFKKEVKEYQLEYEKIKDKVEAVSPGPAFGRLHNRYGVPSYGAWMPGVAVAAHYLGDKLGLKGLKVCQTMEAFQEKIDKLINSPNDERCVFIIPTVNTDMMYQWGLIPNNPQHKISIGVEKMGQDLNIAILDCSPLFAKYFDPENCAKELGLWKEPFVIEELVLRAILSPSLNKFNTHLYASAIVRQTAMGCESFSLRDGIEFLRDLEFFKKIKLSNKKKAINEQLNVELIKAFLPAFMQGTQSITCLNKFKAENPEVLNEKFPTKDKTLVECLPKSMVKVNDKEQNHYITWKMYKYNRLILQQLIDLSQDELKHIFEETLVQ